ncbi:nicotinate-nucleotide adenylyltransferase [Rickettsiella endosymbiont of Aleochara curtula]|jgi:nicotinate-nucleotide adenylyltransferase|uniref:nicotinate-nucleotide adenylyltransferase n=1 Tax=Rickettsiella endosymbiont of Aleochara curtula TaxID=3077936 RepID=UPI00313B8E0D
MIGIFGGSFDPIHYGHLHVALTLYQQLRLNEVRFIPCKNSVSDKKIVASGQQRLTMLQLALQPYSYFSIDQRELRRATPSYMIETLASLRLELGNTPLGLILGYDNLATLDRWQQWTSLIDYAHLLIVPRPDQAKSYPKEIHAFVESYQTLNPLLLSQQPAGLLFMTDVKALPISATYIRQTIASGNYPVGLLPPAVLDYILEQKLYL